jgi:5-methyltetrahydropteroyltriglutamate--homocysteine methyltransferase
VTDQIVEPVGTAFLTTPLLTHELGSLAKPNWRVRGVAGQPIDEGDIEDARVWGERLGVEGYEELLDVLRRTPLDAAGKDAVKAWSSRYAVRLLESVGLDVV